MTELYVVRHGNTFAPGEPVRRIGAHTDIALTIPGVEQAEALGRYFRGLGVSFARALSGPLRRTRRTAEAILWEIESPIPLEWADFLLEIDHGDDEGQPEERVVERLGEKTLERWDREAIVPEGWIVDTDGRIAAWKEFAETAGEGPVLLVTSNGSARFALLAFGLWPEGGLKLRTGSYGRIALEDGKARLVEWDIRPTEDKA